MTRWLIKYTSFENLIIDSMYEWPVSEDESVESWKGKGMPEAFKSALGEHN